jgi:hypothetical protein
MKSECFVCGKEVGGGCFAQLSTGHQTVSLCSAQCAEMFFEVEPPPAHDHRARHNFQRMRAAILASARHVINAIKETNRR